MASTGGAADTDGGSDGSGSSEGDTGAGTDTAAATGSTGDSEGSSGASGGSTEESGSASTTGVESEPWARSGSRLEVRGSQVDGTFVAQSVYDTELEMQCRFTSFSDGAYRCAPRHVELLSFADPQCTQPMARGTVTQCETDQGYAFLNHSSVCGAEPEWEVFRVTDTPVTRDGNFYSMRSGECVATPDPVTEFFTAEAVASDSFVTATLDSVTTGEVVVQTFDAEDGARWPAWFEDPQRSRCNPEFDKCVPYSSLSAGWDDGVGGTFADAMCTARLVATSPCIRAPVARIGGAAERSDECAGHPEYFARGDQATMRDTYRVEDGSCVASEPAETYELGEKIPWDSFPDVTWAPAPDGGGERLIAQYWSSAGAELSAPSRWYDTQLDTYCEPVFDGDTLRCVPVRAAHFFGLFADAGCTQELASISPCDLPASYVIQRAGIRCDPNLRAELARVAELGAAHEGLFYSGTPGDCSEVQVGSSGLFFVVGDPVDARMFAELTDAAWSE